MWMRAARRTSLSVDIGELKGEGGTSGHTVQDPIRGTRGTSGGWIARFLLVLHCLQVWRAQ